MISKMALPRETTNMVLTDIKIFKYFLTQDTFRTYNGLKYNFKYVKCQTPNDL